MQKCCFCFTLEKGCIVLGAVYTVLCSLATLGAIYLVYKAATVYNIVVLVVLILQLIASICLLLGAKSRNRSLLLVYIGLTIVRVLGEAGFIVYTAVQYSHAPTKEQLAYHSSIAASPEDIAIIQYAEAVKMEQVQILVGWTLDIFLHIYFLYAVYCYRRQLDREQGNPVVGYHAPGGYVATKDGRA